MMISNNDNDYNHSWQSFKPIRKIAVNRCCCCGNSNDGVLVLGISPGAGQPAERGRPCDITSTKCPVVLLSHRRLATDRHCDGGKSVGHRVAGPGGAGSVHVRCATVRITIFVHSFYGRSSVPRRRLNRSSP